jgi:hypothetical protein
MNAQAFFEGWYGITLERAQEIEQIDRPIVG